ncbi:MULTISPECIES: DUF3955 domain-containing protein [Vibrio oreintalis group]|uniref:DUF3955 domain-containing protein n=1 Tax=Vibrio europaeus TaxID=300876 RepID=A0A178J493_9VIBR|nr:MULTISPECIES: DUF3955 domain-containing protein [Vibrio oreintalis group]MCG9784539.1 DUF3955 domain-containing protein [Vibrio brasiliensis]MDC5706733.1 DUF3955 domain-containing protein [Vibrio europaeus]MDC5711732.1 DUF3955 domain-containing protein [Vibrio europaeus]MDC5716302.1 DUF3955 domain-containing protein [Vibrio europaeus]MDC5725873.1 DUF3955 domain-containing protein [Vibrio europaeus]
MKILKNFWVSALFLAFSVACFISFHLIGSYVDEGGMLVEPFGFIPLFWLFIFLALISFFVSLFRSWKNRANR